MGSAGQEDGRTISKGGGSLPLTSGLTCGGESMEGNAEQGAVTGAKGARMPCWVGGCGKGTQRRCASNWGLEAGNTGLFRSRPAGGMAGAQGPLPICSLPVAGIPPKGGGVLSAGITLPKSIHPACCSIEQEAGSWVRRQQLYLSPPHAGLQPAWGPSGDGSSRPGYLHQVSTLQPRVAQRCPGTGPIRGAHAPAPAFLPLFLLFHVPPLPSP